MIDHMFALAQIYPQVELFLPEAIAGDYTSIRAILDFVEEEEIEVHPFKVGECYYIETQTLYYIGKCVEVSPCWIHFEKASWIHWTGKKSSLMKERSFDKKHFKQGETVPRTEYIGEWNEAIWAITGYCTWPENELPERSLS